MALYHKVHVGVDGGTARIVTALDVTPGDMADEELLDRIRKEHEGTTGRAVAEVTADAKYGTHEIYTMLEAAGIHASIPRIALRINSARSRASTSSTTHSPIALRVPRAGA